MGELVEAKTRLIEVAMPWGDHGLESPLLRQRVRPVSRIYANTGIAADRDTGRARLSMSEASGGS